MPMVEMLKSKNHDQSALHVDANTRLYLLI